MRVVKSRLFKILTVSIICAAAMINTYIVWGNGQAITSDNSTEETQFTTKAAEMKVDVSEVMDIQAETIAQEVTVAYSENNSLTDSTVATSAVVQEVTQPETQTESQTEAITEAQTVPETESQTIDENTQQITTAAAIETSNNAFANEVLTLVNAERQKIGLAPLQYSLTLETVATIRTNDNLTQGYISHDRTGGRKFSTAFSDLGISYTYVGENLAEGYQTPEDVVNAWMNSPTHRDNILNGRFTKLGVACADDGTGWVYWTQIFSE